MSTSTFSSIAEQVKLDLLSKTHALDNAAKRKEIARNFVCELYSRQYFHLSNRALNWYSRHNHRLSSDDSRFYRLISERENPVPTEEMYAYATLATLGDDVYFEPSTV